MSITIRKDAWRIKDDNGVYRSADLFSTMLPSEARQLVVETQTEFTSMQNQLTTLAATKQQEIIDEGSAQVMAVNTKGQEVLASIPDDYPTVSHAVDAILQGGFIYNTVNGNAVNFDDGADEMLIKSLVANIEPAQDLHGYDHPWPAGGGTNICDEVFEQGTVAVAGNNSENDTRIRTKNYIPIQPNTQYFAVTPGVLGVRYYDANKTFLGSSYNAIVYDNTTFTTPEGAYYMRFSVADVSEYANNIAINYPPTVTTYSPYSNICPPTGWTELNGARTGKNIFGGNAMKEAILTNIQNSTADGLVVTFPANKAGDVVLFDGFKPNTQYTFLLNLRRTDVTGSGGIDSNLQVKYTDGTVVRVKPVYDGTGNRVNYQLLTDANKSVEALAGMYNSKSTEIDTAMSGIFVGNVGWDDFEPYNDDSETISVNWQSTAGEVFGGTVDIVSGKMRATWGSFDIGNVAWNNDTANQRFFRQVNGIKLTTGPRRTTMFCPVYQSIDDGRGVAAVPDCSVYAAGTSEAVYIKDTRYSTAADFQEANQGNIVVYPLAEPIEYQLTPLEVTTLLGVNNIWVDTGDVTVTYPVDTKTYIDRKIQEAIDGLSGS